MFGGGAGPKVATSLQRSGATGQVASWIRYVARCVLVDDKVKVQCLPEILQANRETFVPYYYTADGYAALGHTGATRFDRLLVRPGLAWGCQFACFGHL